VLYTLVLVCHYTGRTEYWVPFHDAMSRLGATAPTDVRLLAKTFADPVTAPNRTLSELDDQIGRLRNTEDDALIIRTAIAGFYADRLPGCREALLRVVRDRREGGAVGTAIMALHISPSANSTPDDGTKRNGSQPREPPCARSADTGCMPGPAATPSPWSPATGGNARHVRTSARR
jgi:hypothetical protein